MFVSCVYRCRRFPQSVVVILGMLIWVNLFVASAVAQDDEWIEVESQEFRFIDILAAQITYDLDAIIPEILSSGANAFSMVVIPSPGEFPSDSAQPIVTLEACAPDECFNFPQTKDIVNQLPTGHVNGESVYRVRANLRIRNDQGVPIFVGTLPPTGTITHAALHLRGDYNYDNVVNAADYTVWRDTRGSMRIPANGDGTGSVDAADYAVWRKRYGKLLASSAASETSVPEPTAFVSAVILGLVGLISMRNRR